MTEQDNDPKEQPLVSHLIELRDRIMRSAIVVLVIFAALLSFRTEIYEIVSSPLTDILPEGSTMIATDVASPFFAPLKLTFFTALLFSVPFLLHQAWAFIAPGLYKNEIRIALPILVSSVVLFYIGVLFAYFLVLGFAFAFFTTEGPANVAIMTDISAYLDFVLLVFFAFGVCFEIPVAVVLLVLIGVLDPYTLTQKRPYVIVGCFTIAMFLTPGDPFTLFLMAIPMCLLFEIGVIAGKAMHRKKEEGSDEEDQKEGKAAEEAKKPEV